MSLHPNHVSPSSEHHLLVDQLEAIKDRVQRLVAEITGTPERRASRIRSFADKATELVREHPLAVAGIALGAGYLIVRIVRR